MGVSREPDPESSWSPVAPPVLGPGADAAVDPVALTAAGPPARDADRAEPRTTRAAVKGVDVVRPVPGEPWRLSHMMLLIVGIAIACWMWVTLGNLLLVILAIAVIVAIMTAGFVTARLRLTRQDALLSILGIAAERKMPLGPAVAAFADQFGGLSRRRVAQIAASLESGVPLPDALQYPRRAVSRDALLLVRVGHETGMLDRALRLTGVARATQLAAWSAIATRAAYFLIVLLAGEAVLASLNLTPRRVVGAFPSIFADFGVRLPWPTVRTLALVDWIDNNPEIFVLIVSCELAALLYVPLSFGGWMNYRVAFFDRLFPRRHTALGVADALAGDRGEPADCLGAVGDGRALPGEVGSPPAGEGPAERPPGRRLDRNPVADGRDATGRRRAARLGVDGRQPRLGLP